jgi:preprotein translocase subunit YajC
MSQAEKIFQNVLVLSILLTLFYFAIFIPGKEFIKSHTKNIPLTM